MRFWDSSAIVPLVVEQPQSAQADAWLEQDPTLVIWALTPVELQSAIFRVVREGKLDESDATRAEHVAAEVVEASHTVTDLRRARARAMQLLRVHDLRAADALQLAAALLWADGLPEDLTFHTFDTRLASAARREGFRVN